MSSPGFLGIWSDVDPAIETDYLHWMTREHAIERVSIPGFLAMRMFRALHGDSERYFILYELESPNVVGGDAYLARLNNPTAWSQRIMPQLRNFIRGGGHVGASAGTGRGGFLCPIRLAEDAVDEPLLRSIAAEDRITSVRLLKTDARQTSVPTKEKGMRSGDQSFAGLLLIEGLDEAAIAAALATLPTPLQTETRVYATIFALDKRLLGLTP